MNKKMLTVLDAGPPDRTPFERFKEFAQRIVAVPRDSVMQRPTSGPKRTVRKPTNGKSKEKHQ